MNEASICFTLLFHVYILEGMRMPPSNRITVPFNIEFSTPSLTTLANSSGFPGLSGNSITLVKLALTLSLIKAVMPLSKRLGAIVITRIPYLARSRVNGSVREANAPFDAAYETCPGCPSKLYTVRSYFGTFGYRTLTQPMTRQG